jgi:hypothetical protein
MESLSPEGGGVGWLVTFGAARGGGLVVAVSGRERAGAATVAEDGDEEGLGV